MYYSIKLYHNKSKILNKTPFPGSHESLNCKIVWTSCPPLNQARGAFPPPLSCAPVGELCFIFNFKSFSFHNIKKLQILWPDWFIHYYTLVFIDYRTSKYPDFYNYISSQNFLFWIPGLSNRPSLAELRIHLIPLLVVVKPCSDNFN